TSADVGFTQSGTGAVATDLQARGQLVVNITDFMSAAQRADAILASPTLDHASAMSAAIAKVMGAQAAITARGGSIYIPAGYYIRLATNPFGVLPNDGATLPTQVPIRIYGAVSDASGSGTIAYKGASLIDFRYTTTNNAKIDTRGRGVLELDHLVLTDTSGNSEPFIFSSNTSIIIHDNIFVGSKTSLWDQDAIILGGTNSTNVATSSADAPFQGYGSQIYNNHFHRIRRAVYAKMYANGVPVHHNTVWLDSGFTTGAAFEYDGDPLSTVQSLAGIPLHHNLVEMTNYKYGVLCREVTNSTLGPNDFYDPGSSTTAYYTFGLGALFNLVIGGQHTDTKTFVEETSNAIGSNTWLTSHQAQTSKLSQPLTISNMTADLVTFNGSSNRLTVQPAASQSDSGILFRMLRSAAESSNPGTNVFQVQQSGLITIGGSGAGNINFNDAAGTAV